jgi:hypothetical protein
MKTPVLHCYRGHKIRILCTMLITNMKITNWYTCKYLILRLNYYPKLYCDYYLNSIRSCADDVGRHSCEVLASNNKAILLLIPQTATLRNKFCADTAICNNRHAARIPPSVPLKSCPIHLLKTAQIFDPISYLILRVSLNNAQKDATISSFKIPSNSSFKNCPNIRPYILFDTASVVQ